MLRGATGRLKVFNRFPDKINANDYLLVASKLTTENCRRRNFSRSSVLVNYRGEESYGSYTKGPDIDEVFKRIWNHPGASFRKLYEIWSNEFKLFGKEMKDFFKIPERSLTKGDIDMLFTFDAENCLENWIITTDKSNNQGFSTASFVRTNNDTAIFSGNIDTTVPQDGKTKYAGFANILSRRLLKSFKRFTTYDWEKYTHLVLKVRGDGRNYMIILGCPSFYDVTWQYQYHYPLYTRGGPYWQIAKIPFSNFYFSHGGKLEDRQHVMGTECSRVGITLADGKNGPFKLEIEYFGLEYQPFHKSISPYEGYYLGLNIAE